MHLESGQTEEPHWNIQLTLNYYYKLTLKEGIKRKRVVKAGKPSLNVYESEIIKIWIKELFHFVKLRC